MAAFRRSPERVQPATAGHLKKPFSAPVFPDLEDVATGRARSQPAAVEKGSDQPPA